MVRSRVGQIEATLDALDARIHPIQSARHISIPVLKTADALFYLADIVAHAIGRAADVAQMLKDNVIGLDHEIDIS
jgi:hypothetical protein